jgi:chromosome segregation ATPase
VTYEAVAAAARQLCSENQRPTLERVRLLCGGSYSTIGTHLRQWRVTPEGRQAPTAPPEIIQKAVDQVWEELSSAHEAEIQGVRQAADEAIAEAQQARDLAAAEARRLSTDLEAAFQDVEGLQGSLRAADATIVELRSSNAAAAATLSEHSARLSEQAQRIEQADRSHEQATMQIAELLKRLEAAEMANRISESARGQACAEREQIRAECNQLQVHREQERAQLGLVKQDLANKNEQLGNALGDCERLKAELHQVRLSLADFARRTSEEAESKLAAERVEASRKHDELVQRLEAIEARLPPPRSARSSKMRRQASA